MSLVLSTIAGIFFVLPTPAYSQTLTVAAASDLTNLQPDLAGAWRAATPGTDLRFVTAASAVLMQQIENGAPYDVFMSANARYAEQLASIGKISPGSLQAYAVGQVGVLWRDGKKHPLSDLRLSSVRFIALPNPKLAPYGVAAEQALQHAGVWSAISQKIVYGENVRQTLQLFESRNADVVLTSDSLLQGKDADVLPGDWHDPIVQKAGIVAASSHRQAATRFMHFLTSPSAEAVFARFGFSKP